MKTNVRLKRDHDGFHAILGEDGSNSVGDAELFASIFEWLLSPGTERQNPLHP